MSARRTLIIRGAVAAAIAVGLIAGGLAWLVGRVGGAGVSAAKGVMVALLALLAALTFACAVSATTRRDKAARRQLGALVMTIVVLLLALVGFVAITLALSVLADVSHADTLQSGSDMLGDAVISAPPLAFAGFGWGLLVLLPIQYMLCRTYVRKSISSWAQEVAP